MSDRFGEQPAGGLATREPERHAARRRVLAAAVAFVVVGGAVGLTLALTVGHDNGSPGTSPPLATTASASHSTPAAVGQPTPSTGSPTASGGAAACTPVTEANAPSADPAAVARILAVPYRSGLRPWSTSELNYIALVDQAARNGDLPMLSALSGCGTGAASAAGQAALWRQPGVLPGLITVLEKTHAAPTDGLTFPGLLLTEMTSPYDVEDLQALGGIGADGRAHFVSTFFSLEPGKDAPGHMSWAGVDLRALARPTKLTAQISDVPGGSVRVGKPTVFTVTLSNFTGHGYSNVAPALAVVYGGDSADARKFTGTIERWDPAGSTWTRDPFPYPPLDEPPAVPSAGAPLAAGATTSFTFRITVSATPDASKGALVMVDIVQPADHAVVGTLNVDLPIS